MERVKLNALEITYASLVGTMRYVKSRVLGAQNPYGMGNSVKKDVIGAIGEVGVARKKKLYFEADTNWADADLMGMQIRAVAHPKHKLIVRPGDNDEEIFILADARSPPYVEICGWMWGKQAKKEQWIKAPGEGPPAYFVPRGALNSMKSLEINIEIKTPHETQKHPPG